MDCIIHATLIFHFHKVRLLDKPAVSLRENPN